MSAPTPSASTPGIPRPGMPPPGGPFAERLARACADAGSCLCVGLDPDPARLPASVGVEAFCRSVVDATAAHAAAFKPNLAFFEALGTEGADALAAVAEAVQATGRLLVLDGKRGDIGTTGARYAVALYDRLGGDAATVAPYMGTDSIAPFLQHAGRCAFVLVATSNPGADDLQTLPLSAETLGGETLGGETVADRVAAMAVSAGASASGTVGFVVGATRPERLAALRAAYPAVPFLVPGVGAQGGRPQHVGTANAGGPLLVNASRVVLYASSGPDFAHAAGRAAAALAAELVL